MRPLVYRISRRRGIRLSRGGGMRPNQDPWRTRRPVAAVADRGPGKREVVAAVSDRGYSAPQSTLTPRTIEGGAARLYDSEDAAFAARLRAGGALLVVDLEAMLEIAQRAVRLAMVAQGRAAGGDGLFEHGANGARQRMRLGAGRAALQSDRAGRAFRGQPGPVQGFADIDVAEPGDEALVEQRRLERPFAAGEQAGKRGAVQIVAERLETEPFERRGVARLVERLDPHRAEAARIVVDDARAVGEADRHMIMRRIFRAGEMEFARRRLLPVALDAERPRHAEMHDQSLAAVEMDENVFGAARQLDDRPADQPLDEALRKRRAQIGPRQHDALDPRADHRRGEALADGFDFGEFRHGRCGGGWRKERQAEPSPRAAGRGWRAKRDG